MLAMLTTVNSPGVSEPASATMALAAISRANWSFGWPVLRM
jgi:hypothetical protein